MKLINLQLMEFFAKNAEWIFINDKQVTRVLKEFISKLADIDIILLQEIFCLVYFDSLKWSIYIKRMNLVLKHPK